MCACSEYPFGVNRSGSTLEFYFTLSCAVLRYAVLCCAVLCCAMLCCAVLCCAVLCCAMLNSHLLWDVLYDSKLSSVILTLFHKL